MINQMKKSWFIFALLLVLLNTGCGSKSNTVKAPSKDTYNNTGLSGNMDYSPVYPIGPAEEKHYTCPICGGSGYRICPDCNGSGKMDEMFQGVIRAMEHGRCVRCEGTGKVTCTDCLGRGTF